MLIVSPADESEESDELEEDEDDNEDNEDDEDDEDDNEDFPSRTQRSYVADMWRMVSSRQEVFVSRWLQLQLTS